MCHFYQHPRPSSMTRLFVAEQNNRKWITTSGATTNYTANSMEKEAITAIAQGNLACSTIVSASSGRSITGSREPHFKTMRRSAKFCVNNINVDHKVGKTYTARAPKKINWYFISFSYCLPRSRFFAPRHASRSFVLAEQAEIIRSPWVFPAGRWSTACRFRLAEHFVVVCFRFAAISCPVLDSGRRHVKNKKIQMI